MLAHVLVHAQRRHAGLHSQEGVLQQAPGIGSLLGVPALAVTALEHVCKDLRTLVRGTLLELRLLLWKEGIFCRSAHER